jgi:hypothetical protein
MRQRSALAGPAPTQRLGADPTARANSRLNAVYPAARKANVDADLLDEAEIEHGSAKQLIADIGAARRLTRSTTRP